MYFILFSYLGTDLVTALAGLDVHDFPHYGCESFTMGSKKRSCFASTRSRPQTSVNVPDNGFISLELIQSEAGAGRGGMGVPRRSCRTQGLAESSSPRRGLTAADQGVEIRYMD